MSVLNLKVGIVAGVDINDAFAEASLLSDKLDLAWVVFDFNGHSCTVYPDGRGHVYQGCNTVASWTAKGGIQWR